MGAPDIFGAAAAPDPRELQELVTPRFSDDDLALRFSCAHAAELRYTARWAQWHRWDGKRWREDSTLAVFDMVRVICRAASVDCEEKDKATRAHLAAKSTVAAVESLARSDRRHAAEAEQWDADPWVINTPDGIVDLRTGQLGPQRPEAYCTKITAAGPGGRCPLWLRFLDRVTDGDGDLQRFLQRMVGYALTASTREHALFFLYGTGANGKSVFLGTISALLADYARTAPPSSFTIRKTEQHPTDLAGLRGARLVTAIETEDGSRWAEAKIKALTGQDAIAARFMRQDFFQFIPTFKIFVAGNNKPGLRNVDEAIRRRLHLVPFTVTIPEKERDLDLAEKLRAEFPGILQWAVDGCLAWQQQGLNPPKAVKEATAEYLAAEDRLGLWIEERCVTGSAFSSPTAPLFNDWVEWCAGRREHHGSAKAFSEKLQDRAGIEKVRLGHKGTKGLGGIALREDADRC